MRAYFVVAVSLIGVLVSLWLVRDAARDRRAFQHVGESDRLVDRITFDRLVAEILRLLVQFSFLIVSVTFAAAQRTSSIRAAAAWLLVMIPAIIAGWSIYAWWGRKHILEDVEEERG